MRRAAMLFLVVASACQETEASSAANSQPEPDSCGADDFQVLVGQDPSVLETYTFNDPHRIFSWDSAVTMDHRPDRLNILIGKNGAIEKVYCG